MRVDWQTFESAGQIVRTPEMSEQARAVFRPAYFPGSGD